MTDEVQNTQPAVEKPYDSDDGIHLFLSYFGIFSLIPFFMYKDKRDNPKKDYVYFHARQGLAEFVACFAFFFVFTIIWGVLWLIPVLGWLAAILGMCLFPLMGLAWLGISILGWVKAFNGVRYEIPVISKVSDMFGK